jgi:hypothetical protein
MVTWIPEPDFNGIMTELTCNREEFSASRVFYLSQRARSSSAWVFEVLIHKNKICFEIVLSGLL